MITEISKIIMFETVGIIAVTLFGMMLIMAFTGVTLMIDLLRMDLQGQIKDWLDYYDYLESKKNK